MNPKNIVVFFDLETSGLDPETHAITEIAAVAFDIANGWKECGEFYRKVKFNIATASPQALLTNSIGVHLLPDGANVWDFEDSFDELPATGIYKQLEDVAQAWNQSASSPYDVERDFSRFLKENATVPKLSRAGKPYTVSRLGGHNVIKFDMPFLQAWYRRLGEAKNGRGFFLAADWWAVDTIQTAIDNYTYDGVPYANFKLETLLKHHGIAVSQEHDAMGDIRLTAALARVLRRQITLDDSITPEDNEAIKSAQKQIELVNKIRTS